MTGDPAKLSGPDLALGIALEGLADRGKLLGHAGGEQVLLVRSGGEIFAVGARCTHRGGPLAGGLVIADTIRCPWHAACFDLRSGAALAAPAIDALDCWPVEVENGRAFVRERLVRQ